MADMTWNPEALRTARLAADISPEALAAAGGISTRSLARYEASGQGAAEPSFSTGMRLAKAAGVRPEELLRVEAQVAA